MVLTRRSARFGAKILSWSTAKSTTATMTMTSGDDDKMEVGQGDKMKVGQVVNIWNGMYQGSSGVIAKTTDKMVTIQLDHPVFIVNIRDGRKVSRMIVTIRKSNTKVDVAKSTSTAAADTASTGETTEVLQLKQKLRTLEQRHSHQKKTWKGRIKKKNEQIGNLVAKVQEKDKFILRQSQTNKSLQQQLHLEKNRQQQPNLESFVLSKKRKAPPPSQPKSTTASMFAKKPKKPKYDLESLENQGWLSNQELLSSPEGKKPAAVDNTTKKRKQSRHDEADGSSKRLKSILPRMLSTCQYTEKQLKNQILPKEPPNDWSKVASQLVQGGWKYISRNTHFKFTRQYSYSTTTACTSSDTNGGNSETEEIKEQSITIPCTPRSQVAGKRVLSKLSKKDEAMNQNTS